MFNNIGKKIMTLAKILCIAGIVLSVIMAIVAFAGGNAVSTVDATGVTYKASGVVVGITTLIVGVLGSWIGSWMMYAAGQAVEDLHKIAQSKN